MQLTIVQNCDDNIISGYVSRPAWNNIEIVEARTPMVSLKKKKEAKTDNFKK